jgi:hypothetical protein
MSQFTDFAIPGISSQIDNIPQPQAQEIHSKVVDDTAEQVRMSFESFLER